MNGPNKLAVGDIVMTAKGARFEGEIRAIFVSRAGKERCVVEAVQEEFEQTLHVYPLDRLVRK